jgi:hypothetical protein
MSGVFEEVANAYRRYIDQRRAEFKLPSLASVQSEKVGIETKDLVKASTREEEDDIAPCQKRKSAEAVQSELRERTERKRVCDMGETKAEERIVETNGLCVTDDTRHGELCDGKVELQAIHCDRDSDDSKVPPTATSIVETKIDTSATIKTEGDDDKNATQTAIEIIEDSGDDIEDTEAETQAVTYTTADAVAEQHQVREERRRRVSELYREAHEVLAVLRYFRARPEYEAPLYGLESIRSRSRPPTNRVHTAAYALPWARPLEGGGPAHGCPFAGFDLTAHGLVLAGGAVCARLAGRKPRDYDLWCLHTNAKEMCRATHALAAHFLTTLNVPQNDPTYRASQTINGYLRSAYREPGTSDIVQLHVVRTMRCITFVWRAADGRTTTRPPVQIVVRQFKNVGAVLYDFDLGAAAVAYDPAAKRYRFAEHAKLAYERGCNVADPQQHSFAYPTRVASYWCRGFGFVLPNLAPRALLGRRDTRIVLAGGRLCMWRNEHGKAFCDVVTQRQRRHHRPLVPPVPVSNLYSLVDRNNCNTLDTVKDGSDDNRSVKSSPSSPSRSLDVSCVMSAINSFTLINEEEKPTRLKLTDDQKKPTHSDKETLARRDQKMVALHRETTDKEIYYESCRMPYGELDSLDQVLRNFHAAACGRMSGLFAHRVYTPDMSFEFAVDYTLLTKALDRRCNSESIDSKWFGYYFGAEAARLLLRHIMQTRATSPELCGTIDCQALTDALQKVTLPPPIIPLDYSDWSRPLSPLSETEWYGTYWNGSCSSTP